MRRVLLILGLLLIVIVAGFTGLLLTLDVNQYKPRIEASVRDATHREFTIGGAIAVKPALIPTLTVEGVTLGNVATSSNGPMLTIAHFEAQVALLPLLARRIEISRVELAGVRVLLETTADGRGNWQFNAAQAPAAHSLLSLPAFDVKSLVVGDAKLDYRPFGKAAQSAAIEKLSVLSSAPTTPLKIDAALRLHAQTLTVKGELAPLAAWLKDATCAFDLVLAGDSEQAKIKGEINTPLSAPSGKLNFEAQVSSLAALGKKFDTRLPELTALNANGQLGLAQDTLDLDMTLTSGNLKLALKGPVAQLRTKPTPALQFALSAPSLAALGALNGLQLPALAPFNVSGKLTATTNSATIKGFVLHAGASDASGTLSFTGLDGRPRVEGRLTAQRLDLSPFDPPASAKTTQRERVFSSEPLPLASLKAVDTNLDITAATLITHGLTLNAVQAHLQLERGNLKLDPFAASLDGGTLRGRLVLDGGASTHLKLSLQIHQLKLARWLDGKSGLSAPKGVADAVIDIDGHGVSVAALMGSANGHIKLDARELVMRGNGAGFASADLLMSALSLLNPLSQRSDHTRIECAVVNFPVVAGRMESKTGIGLSTDSLRILGGGTIDLGSEKLDIGVDPKPRGGIGLNVAGIADFVRIGGTLSAPTAVTDASGVASAGVKVGAAFATGGLSLLAEGLLDRSGSDVDACAVARGDKALPAAQSAAQTQPSATTKVGGAASTVVEGAGNVVKGAGNAVQSVFKSLFGD